MRAARAASQEKERWRRRRGIRTAHELHASAQMTRGRSNPGPLLSDSAVTSVSPIADKSNGTAAAECCMASDRENS